MGSEISEGSNKKKSEISEGSNKKKSEISEGSNKQQEISDETRDARLVSSPRKALPSQDSPNTSTSSYASTTEGTPKKKGMKNISKRKLNTPSNTRRSKRLKKMSKKEVANVIKKISLEPICETSSVSAPSTPSKDITPLAINVTDEEIAR